MHQFFVFFLQTVVAFIASTAFAIIFHAPKNQRYFAGATGAVGWLIYTVLTTSYAIDVVPSSFFATLGLAAIARAFSYWRKAPVTTFLITGVFPLVPGAGIYSTGYALFMGNNSTAMYLGLQTIQIAIVMALGMGLVLSLPHVIFSLQKRSKKGADA